MTLLQSILVYFIRPILGFLVFIIFIEVIFSWLVAFNVVNLNKPAIRQFYYAIQAMTRPLLDPIRAVIPSFNGIDFSPIVALLGLQWISGYIVPSLYPLLG